MKSVSWFVCLYVNYCLFDVPHTAHGPSNISITNHRAYCAMGTWLMMNTKHDPQHEHEPEHEYEPDTDTEHGH